MPTIRFTENLRRHVEAPGLEVPAATVRDALSWYFERYPAVRGYVLDDRDRLRQHMLIFVGGKQVEDRVGLTDAVAEDAEIYVMQALSGG